MVEELNVGDKVEVRRRFDAQWAGGSRWSRSRTTPCGVRRTSDGVELPAEFAPDDIRKAHKRANDFWWM